MFRTAAPHSSRQVVHDLNNLLTAIIAHSEMLMERTRDDVSLSRHVDELHRAAERAAGLVGRLQAHESGRRD